MQACAPLEMVSTVMMCKGGEGTMMDELSATWKKEGWKGMFKGNGANCLKVAPSRGTQFLVFEFMKRRIVAGAFFFAAAGAPLNAFTRLFAGGVAGMAAAALVYPLEVIKTILTVYPDQCTGIGEAVEAIFKIGGGVRGLYAGLLPTLVAMFRAPRPPPPPATRSYRPTPRALHRHPGARGAPQPPPHARARARLRSLVLLGVGRVRGAAYIGVEFMVYETLKRQWELQTGASAGTLILLLCGAISGAAGQASAHPLDVVRRRMQMEGPRKKFMADDKSDAKLKKPPVKNLVSGLWNIGRQEGWHVLLKGLGPACFEKVPSTAIGYYIYEAMKTAMKVSSI